MRRLFILVTLFLLGPQLLAGVQWARRANLATASLLNAEANLSAVPASRPVVLLETNYYTYVAGDPLSCASPSTRTATALR